MTPQQQALLTQINTTINAIPYVATPGPTEPVDYWTYEPVPGQSWVCRDYTQSKAQWLRHHGFDPATLTVVLCWTEPEPPPPQAGEREYHAVLAVQGPDDVEPMILDSRFPDIYPLNAPPVDYRWDRRQVPGTDRFETMST